MSKRAEGKADRASTSLDDIGERGLEILTEGKGIDERRRLYEHRSGSLNNTGTPKL